MVAAPGQGAEVVTTDAHGHVRLKAQAPKWLPRMDTDIRSTADKCRTQMKTSIAENTARSPQHPCVSVCIRGKKS